MKKKCLKCGGKGITLVGKRCGTNFFIIDCTQCQGKGSWYPGKRKVRSKAHK